MNFIISSSALLKSLQRVSGVIPSRSVLPIVENFLFEIKGNDLSISTTNLEISMKNTLPIESRGGDLSIAIPHRILLDTLKALPDQPLTFSVDEETFAVEIASEMGKYRLSGENGLDFPKIPVPENTASLSMPGDLLIRSISKTIFAASSDDDKAALNGIFLDLNKESITLVTTDANRLVRLRRVDVTGGDPNSIIVPQKAMALVKNAFGGTDGPVKIEYNDNNAFFSTDGLILVCRLIDQQYPDYENVIPTENPSKLIIGKRDLLGSLTRVNIFANKTSHQVRFKITGSELEISSEDLDFSNEAREVMKCTYEGEDMEIGFNAALLIDLINNVDDDEVIIELSTPNRAGILLPGKQTEGENILMMIMPVILNSFGAY